MTRKTITVKEAVKHAVIGTIQEIKKEGKIKVEFPRVVNFGDLLRFLYDNHCLYRVFIDLKSKYVPPIFHYLYNIRKEGGESYDWLKLGLEDAIRACYEQLRVEVHTYPDALVIEKVMRDHGISYMEGE